MENFDSRTVLNVANVEIPGRVFLAPMAGITDLPYRRICRAHGAAYAVAEMVASQAQLRTSRKSQERFNLKGEQAPRGIQLRRSDYRSQLRLPRKKSLQCGERRGAPRERRFSEGAA